MKASVKLFFCRLSVLMGLSYSVMYAGSQSGFYLPEPYVEASMRYTTFNNLIILPFTINSRITVNLILDTGTSNIVLFGKRFEKLFQFIPKKNIQFSGMGSGEQVTGKLSINNRVELTSIIGERIAIVVVPNNNIFDSGLKIDGIIGYDIFQRFEVEINPVSQLISFRPWTESIVPAGFIRVPLRIENTKPIINSDILLFGGTLLKTDLIIDTGSQLSLLIKTTNNALAGSYISTILGRGLSGSIEGIKTFAHTLTFAGLIFYNEPTGIVQKEGRDDGSIGMGILKNYAIIINYNAAFACLKKL